MDTNPKIASGSTIPGATAWQQYNDGNGNPIGVSLVVDTGDAGFSDTPRYITSIVGDHYHWETTGASSVYEATATSFKVYVRWWNGLPLDPATANGYNWHINWIAVAP